MEILKSDRYLNEKLNIQPVTKDRLANVVRPNMYKTPIEMKEHFKTGDIALMSSTSDKKLCVFISYEDFSSDKYPFIAKELLGSNENATVKDILKTASKNSLIKKMICEGCFIASTKDNKIYILCGLADLDERLMGNTYGVWSVFRKNAVKPFERRDFASPLMSKAVKIYEYIPTNIS